jgi:hypothetical protein
VLFRMFRRKSFIHLVIGWLLIAAVPACQAQTAGPLDKHSRKIAKQLAKFPSGAYLEFNFRDGSQNYGALGRLSETTFQFTDSDNNKIATHSYADLDRVKKAKEFIGVGSRPGHHVRLWVPVAIVAALAGAGVGAYEAMR